MFHFKVFSLKSLILTFEKLELQTTVTNDQNVCWCSVFSISYKKKNRHVSSSIFTVITWPCWCRGVWVCVCACACVCVCIDRTRQRSRTGDLPGKMEMNKGRSSRLHHDPLTWSIISFSISPSRSDRTERPAQNSVTLWHFHARYYVKNALWPIFADLFKSVQYAYTYFLLTLYWLI